MDTHTQHRQTLTEAVSRRFLFSIPILMWGCNANFTPFATKWKPLDSELQSQQILKIKIFQTGMMQRSNKSFREVLNPVFHMMWGMLTANLFMANKKSSELEDFRNTGFLSGLVDDISLREQSLVFMMNLHGWGTSISTWRNVNANISAGKGRQHGHNSNSDKGIKEYLTGHLNANGSGNHGGLALCRVLVQIILEGLESWCHWNEIISKIFQSLWDSLWIFSLCIFYKTKNLHCSHVFLPFLLILMFFSEPPWSVFLLIRPTCHRRSLATLTVLSTNSILLIFQRHLIPLIESSIFNKELGGLQKITSTHGPSSGRCFTKHCVKTWSLGCPTQHQVLRVSSINSESKSNVSICQRGGQLKAWLVGKGCSSSLCNRPIINNKLIPWYMKVIWCPFTLCNWNIDTGLY